LVEQDLGIYEIGGGEAFRKPVVDVGKAGAGFVATPLFREQPCEAHRRPQFERFGALLSRNLNRPLKAGLGRRTVRMVLLQQQFSFDPVRLSLILADFMFISGRQRFRQST
jgi:hypothetical protein